MQADRNIMDSLRWKNHDVRKQYSSVSVEFSNDLYSPGLEWLEGTSIANNFHLHTTSLCNYLVMSVTLGVLHFERLIIRKLTPKRTVLPALLELASGISRTWNAILQAWHLDVATSIAVRERDNPEAFTRSCLPARSFAACKLLRSVTEESHPV